MNAVADGYVIAQDAISQGLEPDPDMLVDKWADENMVLASGKNAAPGQYRTELTPFARGVMRALSPSHPCRRVAVMGPSQLLKTQVAMNWIGACIHQAPGNILTLLPTLPLAKRVSSRFTDTIKLCPPLRERVAEPRSRDARNTMDTKEFIGGSLYITTAGSASNLAEIPARYVYGDEIDRWEGDVGGEGDPVEMAEARTSTFEYNAKIYYTSSPTIEGQSRITSIVDAGNRQHYYVPCPHCHELQQLQWEIKGIGPTGLPFRAGIRWDDDEQPRRAWYVCPHCGCEIEETAKTWMLRDEELGGTARWMPDQAGDGQTESFHINALYAPIGFISWLSLVRQYLKAKVKQEKGDQEPMQVFYNTRLALCWDASLESTKAEELKARAENYRLGTVPAGGLVLTCGVDTQPSRLEVEIKAWGAGMENWVVGYHILWGDPSMPDVWLRLDEILRTPLQHAGGQMLRIAACCVDSGGSNTQDVYNYARHRKHMNVLAIKGASRPNRPVIGRPSKVDVNWNGEIEKEGALLWMVGTDVAKDWIYARFKQTQGYGASHFSKDLPDEYFAQVTAEKKIARCVKGFWRTEWIKKPGDRNEALDVYVYNLAAAWYLGLHAYNDARWEALRLRVNPAQKDMFAESPALPAVTAGPAVSGEPEPVAPAPAQAPAVPLVPAAAPRVAPQAPAQPMRRLVSRSRRG
jgi:phage terminase large subunit GpA-like protein